MANEIFGEVTTPTDDQNKAAFSGSAPAVNRFIASMGPTGLRIAFLEEDFAQFPHFRAAVTMHPQDGVKLYKMLRGMLQEFEEMLSQQVVVQDGGE